MLGIATDGYYCPPSTAVVKDDVSDIGRTPKPPLAGELRPVLSLVDEIKPLTPTVVPQEAA